MGHDVFLSYSSRNKSVADAAVAILESKGIRCWFAPRDILPGATWTASLVRAIDDAKVFVVILSAAAGQSQHVAREVQRAVSKAVPIIPLRIERAELGAALEYCLTSHHWLDALTPPLEQHLNRLVEVVSPLIGDRTTHSPMIANVPKSGIVDKAANLKMVAQLRDDADDTMQFGEELVRVLLRTNLLTMQIVGCREVLEEVGEQTPPKEVARLVEKAIGQVDLTGLSPLLNQRVDQDLKLLPGVLIADFATEWIKGWPQLKRLVCHRWLDDPEEEAAQVHRQLLNAVSGFQAAAAKIETLHKRLKTYQPRYHAVMTPTSFWEIAGAAASDLTRGLGFTTGKVSDEWDRLPDEKFVKQFSENLFRFAEDGVEFAETLERSIEPVLATLRRDFEKFTQLLFAALEQFAQTTDITAIYSEIHKQPSAGGPEVFKQLAMIVLGSLRQRGFSARSEANIRWLNHID
jgi:hypothetical protein